MQLYYQVVLLYSSLTSVGTLTSLNITGNTINNGNLTISGTLQSPMTSLLTYQVI